MNSENFSFFSDAIKMFRDAGHTATSSPVFSNHSYKQVVYFDSDKSLLVDATMAITLNLATNISHLFNLDDKLFDNETVSNIAYYSIVLICDKRNRSQTAHDIHELLHSSFVADNSVVLFKNEDSLLISIAVMGEDIFLSDWFDYYDDIEQVIEKIHIAELSINSIFEFILDFVYAIARDYYIHPFPEGIAIYALIPICYFCTDCTDLFGDDDGNDKVSFFRELLLKVPASYGDDYVEPLSDRKSNISRIDTTLDMLSFELELDLEEDDIVDDETEDNECPDDEYEFDDADQEIFKDPSLMLKWLEKDESENH